MASVALRDTVVQYGTHGMDLIMARTGTRLSTQTRIDGDIVDTATAVADLDHRSTAGQVNYWARLGMEVDRSGSVTTRRAREVAAGRAQFTELTDPERAAAHAHVNAAISGRVADADFGAAARARGVPSVSLDEDGNVIETAPDGTVRKL
jgi:hypothetical protein